MKFETPCCGDLIKGWPEGFRGNWVCSVIQGKCMLPMRECDSNCVIYDILCDHLILDLSHYVSGPQITVRLPNV